MESRDGHGTRPHTAPRSVSSNGKAMITAGLMEPSDKGRNGSWGRRREGECLLDGMESSKPPSSPPSNTFLTSRQSPTRPPTPSLTAQGPVVIYDINGEVQENIYNNANLSASVFSLDFNYTTIESWATMIKSSAVDQVSAQDSLPTNNIILRLPGNGDQTFNVIAEYMYLGSPDDGVTDQATTADAPSSSLLMTGIVGGIRDINLAEDHTFHWFLDMAAQTMEGGVVMGGFYYKFETIEGAVVITQFDVDEGLCRLRKGSDGSNPPKYNEAKEARKAAKRAKMELKRQNRKEKRQEKREQKHGGGGRRALAVEEKQEEKEMTGEAAFDDGHDHHDHHHHHDMHAAIRQHEDHLDHRQLQTVGLLIFLDTAPVSGVYQPWNGGRSITITSCPTTVTVGLLPALRSAVREDFAPFSVEVRPCIFCVEGLCVLLARKARESTGFFFSCIPSLL